MGGGTYRLQQKGQPMKSRSFQSKFFTDPYVQELTLREKFVFLYYIYNERMNWLGTYEVSDKTAVFEIGDIKLEDLRKAKDKFSADNKIFFSENWVIVRNSEKYEKHLSNAQLMRSALKQFIDLPDDAKQMFLSLKPREKVEVYTTAFKELGYNIPSNLLVGYEYPTSRSIINNKEERINKKEEKSLKSSPKILTLEDLQTLSEKINVPLPKVKYTYEKILDYEKSNGKNYKDYEATIRNWLRMERERNGGKAI